MQAAFRWIMHSRGRAAMIVLLATLLPFMQWFAAIIMSLVTLRQGSREGFYQMLIMLIPGGIMLALGRPEMAKMQMVVPLLMWAITAFFYNTQSWNALLKVSTLVGLTLVAVWHAMVPDTMHYWHSLILHNLDDSFLNAASTGAHNALGNFVIAASKIATGTNLLIWLFALWTNVLVARMIQARLYNPGGLRQELLAVEADVLMALVFIVVSVMAYLNHPVAVDMMPLVMVTSLCFGLVTIHRRVQGKKRARSILVLSYLMTVAFFFPMSAVMGIIALIDIFIKDRGESDGSHFTRENI
jgi:hypothetical protein